MNVFLIVIWSFYSSLVLFTVFTDVGSESDGANNEDESPAAQFNIGK